MASEGAASEPYARRGHPIWARVLARFLGSSEHGASARHRRAALEGLSGRVIEIGCGTGSNFPFYPESVEEVVGTEPEPYLRGIAERNAAALDGVRVTIVDWAAESIAAPDGSFDGAVAACVLCSVDEPERALAELRRVVRPGGELRYYEHVRGQAPAIALIQRVADLVVPRVMGGDHVSRATGELIRAAGFEVERERRFLHFPSPLLFLFAPHVLGTARRPAS